MRKEFIEKATKVAEISDSRSLKKEGEKKMNSKMYPVDVDKFDSLVKSWGGYQEVGRKIYRDQGTIRNVLSRGKISRVISDAIYQAYGVPLDIYSKKDTAHAKEVTEPKCIIDIPNEGKEIQYLLREMCNNQVAIYKRLNHLTGIGTRLEDEIIKIRKGER